MGIFDIFKKKKKDDDQYLKSDLNEEKVETPTQSTTSVNDSYSKNTEKSIVNRDAIDDVDASKELFDFIFKYSEYVVRYLNMMFQGNHSPIAAYEKNNGDLIGYLFVAEDMSYNLSVEQVIEKMEVEFEKRISDSAISSWVIFYHSEFNDDDNHKVAGSSSKTRAITAKYSLGNNTGFIGIPYILTGDQVKYKGFSGFSKEQNAQILSVQLTKGKDYFQEKVEIKPEIHENEVGIKIKKVNNGSLGNMWGGVFGFERLHKSNQILLEYMALVSAMGLKRTVPNAAISEMKYKDVVFRAVKSTDDSTRTAYPVIKSNFCIDVINKQINEWENSDNLEAVICGAGRDTFGITYFATDYAENKSVYHSSPKLDMTFSAILFVLTVRDDKEETILPNGASFAEDFAAYMPHKELGEFGCYDFIGILEDFYQNDILEDNMIEGYILKIRLINYEDIKDFFTIPMFINKDNMRLSNLEKGMKISGAFQLQGEIKK
ncbi:hypothetical protein [Mucilaginibacter sp.]|uniref:hypothetical protein n=1 Tax=Mucilaginibacter sp. TaxID=1882438 RepID=UPI002846E227|nr:hypothetical protein [Mucilaginibacter sp.]MDR3695067.1 hypothetical protein [Mucilaginibacter sp.]